MRVRTRTPTEVRAEVENEKADDTVLSPLTDVLELVTKDVLVRGGPRTHQDESSQRRRGSAGRRWPDQQPVTVTTFESHGIRRDAM